MSIENWSEVSEGHWSDGRLHVVDGSYCVPCPKCKATGRRGRGQCGNCYGMGKRRRSYDIPGVGLSVSCSSRMNREQAIEYAERENNPGCKVEFEGV